MKTKRLSGLFVFFAIVFFSYMGANGQVPDAVKDAADKAKDVTVDTTKKTGVIVTDALETAASETKDAASATKKKTKQFGKHAVEVTEDVAGETYEGGKWFVVTTWDGTKWVSKRVMYPNKKQ
jgi:Flp pilus assembly protein TadG